MASKKNSNISLSENDRIKRDSKTLKTKERVNSTSENKINQSAAADVSPIIETRKQSKEELEIEKGKKKEDKLISEEKINVAFADQSH